MIDFSFEKRKTFPFNPIEVDTMFSFFFCPKFNALIFLLRLTTKCKFKCSEFRFFITIIIGITALFVS
jgi:hypothetical protein